MEVAAANINTAIERGVSYLYQHIYPNGEFCCYMANTDNMQDWCVPDTTIFPTTLIANSLVGLRGQPEVDAMLASVTKFLMSQISLGALWQHYTQAHQYYPLLCPDVDNTVFASSVLRELGNQYIHPINTPVILANRNSKGLFYTWFVFRFRININKTYWYIALEKLKKPLHQYFFWKKMECGKYDVDGVVNANALYYLGDTGDTQPIIKYLIDIVEQEKEAICDKWYQNPLVVYYFITRNYRIGIKKLEPVRQLIISRILNKVNAEGRIGESALETAVAICSLLNLHTDLAPVAKSVNWLLSAQHKNGNWDRRLLFYSGPKRTVGWGSEELTTAFCLEALQRYKQAINNI